MTDAGSIEFSVRAKSASREAVALVTLEDSAVLELSIQLPSTWPLHDAKVDCRKKVRRVRSIWKFAAHRPTFALKESD